MRGYVSGHFKEKIVVFFHIFILIISDFFSSQRKLKGSVWTLDSLTSRWLRMILTSLPSWTKGWGWTTPRNSARLLSTHSVQSTIEGKTHLLFVFFEKKLPILFTIFILVPYHFGFVTKKITGRAIGVRYFRKSERTLKLDWKVEVWFFPKISECE